MIQIKIGTTSWKACPTGIADAGYVTFNGTFVYEADGITPAMIWDSGLQNVRQKIAADYTEEAAALVTTLRNQAKAALDNSREAELKIARAALMAMNDAVNQTNAKFASLLNAIAQATSLSNLQTRAAAITAVAARSDADVRQAVKDRIDAGTNTD